MRGKPCFSLSLYIKIRAFGMGSMGVPWEELMGWSLLGGSRLS